MEDEEQGGEGKRLGARRGNRPNINQKAEAGRAMPGVKPAARPVPSCPPSPTRSSLPARPWGVAADGHGALWGRSSGVYTSVSVMAAQLYGCATVEHVKASEWCGL